MFSPYVTAGGPGRTSSVGSPSRLPALPPDTANAAATTARHATPRRQRANFIVLPPVVRSDAHPTRRIRILSDEQSMLQAQVLWGRAGPPRAPRYYARSP